MPNTQTWKMRETKREGQLEAPEPWVPTGMMEEEAEARPRGPARRPTAPRKAKPVRRKAAPSRRGRKAAKGKVGTARKASTRRRAPAPSRTARTGARTKASKYEVSAEHEEPHRMEAGGGWGKKATRKPRAETERW